MCNGQSLKDSNDRCELKKSISIQSSVKFSFWYYMFGRQIGTLELKVDDAVVWHKIGRQEQEWLKAEVSLDAGSQIVKLKLFKLKCAN